MNEQMWWYVARSGGMVALALTGLSVMWGLFYSTKILQGTPSPRWLLDLHRFLGGASVAFTGIHVAGLVLDSYTHFGWAEILIPFASAWHPGAVAWGIVAFYLLIAVQVTSMFMRRIPRRWWKLIHLSSYGLFWAGIVHGATAGTDAGQPLYVAASALGILGVLFLTVYRILTKRRRSPPPTPTNRSAERGGACEGARCRTGAKGPAWPERRPEGAVGPAWPERRPEGAVGPAWPERRPEGIGARTPPRGAVRLG